MRRPFLFGVMVGALVGAPAWGQTGCEDVPEARRGQCERVMDCMAIEDGDVRSTCIAAAQRSVADTPQTDGSQQPVAPPALIEETVIPRKTVAPAPQQPDSRLATRPDSGTGGQPEPLREPPPTFSGEVTQIFASMLERQLIAIDNSYLFESDQAGHARFKVGQTVDAKKRKKSLFGDGRSWRLIGPSTRPVDAFRIRCEREDIGRDDRRRCDRMLDP